MDSTLAEKQATVLEIEIGSAEKGGRLDKVLADRLANRDDLPPLSRSRIQGLIADGRVLATGGPGGARTIEEASYRVKPGDLFRVEIPPAEPAEPEAQAIPLEVLYEDDQLIVVNKPAGLVVHPAPGNPDRTLVNALLAHCGESLSGIGGVRRPGIVHRLDKDTSGVMVVAKTDGAHEGLQAQFAAHGRDGRLERAYTAIVWGTPRPRAGKIATRLGRSPRNRQKMAVLKQGGREAITHYTVTATYGGQDPIAGLVDCRLETGRTHQIRVHLAHLGHPVIGDPLYGTNQRTRVRKLPESARLQVEALDRQALHAHLLGFEHPLTGKSLHFESPLPKELHQLVEAFEEL